MGEYHHPVIAAAKDFCRNAYLLPPAPHGGMRKLARAASVAVKQQIINSEIIRHRRNKPIEVIGRAEYSVNKENGALSAALSEIRTVFSFH